MIKRVVLISLISMSVVSCKKFTNGVVKTINLPDHEPKIAAFMLADARDSSLKTIVSETQGIFETRTPSFLAGVTISLLQNDTMLYSWDTQDALDSTYSLELGDKLGRLKGEIKMVVDHPEYDLASATQKFPNNPEVKDITLDYSSVESQGRMVDKLIIEFKGNSNENQYYIIHAVVHCTDPSIRDTNLYISCALEPLSQNVEKVRFANSSLLLPFVLGSPKLQGEDFTITVNTDIDSSYCQGQQEYKLYISSLSEAYYRYIHTNSINSDSQGNPFAEPVIIYGNLDGGIGCFGLSTTKIYRK